MGLLVDGVWQDDASRTKDGHFIRPTTKFRNWVTPDGSPGPSGKGDFTAEAGRYHLYVSLSCPWAHRTIIFRKLKALENVVSMSVVSPDMLIASTENRSCRRSICSRSRAIRVV
jgi:putative glutathione S-transferase